MKKWYILVLVLVVSSVSARSFKKRKFERAIEVIDRKKIGLLLKKVGRKKLSIDDRKELYADLHDCAADKVDALVEQKRIYFDLFDFGKTVLGTCMIFGGLGIFFGPVRFSRAIRAASGLGSLLGGYLFYKGYTCSRQQGWIAQMQELENEFGARYDELAQKEIQ